MSVLSWFNLYWNSHFGFVSGGSNLIHGVLRFMLISVCKPWQGSWSHSLLWVPNLALPQINCVPLGKSLTLSLPQSSVRLTPSACLLCLVECLEGRRKLMEGAVHWRKWTQWECKVLSCAGLFPGAGSQLLFLGERMPKHGRQDPDTVCLWCCRTGLPGCPRPP